MMNRQRTTEQRVRGSRPAFRSGLHRNLNCSLGLPKVVCFSKHSPDLSCPSAEDRPGNTREQRNLGANKNINTTQKGKGSRKENWFLGWQRTHRLPTPVFLGLSGGSHGKESACYVGDPGSIPGLGKYPGEGNSYPLQFSGLENSIEYTVHGVAKSQTRLSNFHFYTHIYI